MGTNPVVMRTYVTDHCHTASLQYTFCGPNWWDSWQERWSRRASAIKDNCSLGALWPPSSFQISLKLGLFSFLVNSFYSALVKTEAVGRLAKPFVPVWICGFQAIAITQNNVDVLSDSPVSEFGEILQPFLTSLASRLL